MPTRTHATRFGFAAQSSLLPPGGSFFGGGGLGLCVWFGGGSVFVGVEYTHPVARAAKRARRTSRRTGLRRGLEVIVDHLPVVAAPEPLDRRRVGAVAEEPDRAVREPEGRAAGVPTAERLRGGPVDLGRQVV